MTDEQIDRMLDGVMAKHVEKPTHEQLMEACRGKGGEIRSRATVRRAFVYDLMCDTIVKGRTRSINDVFTNKEELRKVFDVLNVRFKKVTKAVAEYDEKGGDLFECGRKMYMHIMDGTRMFSSSFGCAMPTDFPFERCRELIRKYNTNGQMYDPSCGWGSRMCAAIVEGVEYVGTDPNDKLTPRLRQMADAMCEALWANKESVMIIQQGSEEYIPALKGLPGLILTSPPYFDLEDYVHGNQSIKSFNTYDKWLEGFLRPTMENCYKYLTDDGNCIFNVKNFGKVKLFEDMLRIAAETGFIVRAVEPLKNIQRFANNEDRLLNNDECCVVFRKTLE